MCVESCVSVACSFWLPLSQISGCRYRSTVICFCCCPGQFLSANAKFGRKTMVLVPDAHTYNILSLFTGVKCYERFTDYIQVNDWYV